LNDRFPQVRENWKKSGNLSGQVKSGKGQGKILLEKSGKMIIIDKAIEARSRIPIQLHASLA